MPHPPLPPTQSLSPAALPGSADLRRKERQKKEAKTFALLLSPLPKPRTHLVSVADQRSSAKRLRQYCYEGRKEGKETEEGKQRCWFTYGPCPPLSFFPPSLSRCTEDARG